MADARVVLAIAPNARVGRGLARHLHVGKLGARAQLLRGEHGVQHVKLQRLRAVGSHHQRRVLGKRRGGRGGHDAHGVVSVKHRFVAGLVGERVVRVVHVHRGPGDDRVVIARHAQVRGDGVRARLQRARRGLLHLQRAAHVHELVVGGRTARRHQLVGLARLKRGRRAHGRRLVTGCGKRRLAAHEARDLNAQARLGAGRDGLAGVRCHQLGLRDGPRHLDRVDGAVGPREPVLQRGRGHVVAGVFALGAGKDEALGSLHARLDKAVVDKAGRRSRLLNLHALVLQTGFRLVAERSGSLVQRRQRVVDHLLGNQLLRIHRFCRVDSAAESVGGLLGNPRALGGHVGAVGGNHHTGQGSLGRSDALLKRGAIDRGRSAFLSGIKVDHQPQRRLAGLGLDVGVERHRVQLGPGEGVGHRALGVGGQLHAHAADARVVLAVIPHRLVRRLLGLHADRPFGQVGARAKLLQREHRVGKVEHQRLAAVRRNRHLGVAVKRLRGRLGGHALARRAVKHRRFASLVGERVVRVVHVHVHARKHRVVLPRHAQVRGQGVDGGRRKRSIYHKFSGNILEDIILASVTAFRRQLVFLTSHKRIRERYRGRFEILDRRRGFAIHETAHFDFAFCLVARRSNIVTLVGGSQHSGRYFERNSSRLERSVRPGVFWRSRADIRPRISSPKGSHPFA